MRPHLKMRKEQVKRLDGGDSVGQAKFVERLFGVAAWRRPRSSTFTPERISRNTALPAVK